MTGVVTRAPEWPPTAKSLHWATALLVLAQLPLGWIATSWPLSPVKLDLFVWHKSLGFAILGLVAVRLAYRACTTRPPLPSTMAGWERTGATLVHVLLYAGLVALPMSGWIVNDASNIPFRIFRQVPVPRLVAPDRALASLASGVHLALAVALALLLVLHIGAALVHHVARRDGVLEAMLPWRRR